MKAFKIPKVSWIEKIFTEIGIPCGGRNSTKMASTCEEINDSEMDSFSIANYRRDSSHCFYQNRGNMKTLTHEYKKVFISQTFPIKQSFNLF